MEKKLRLLKTGNLKTSGRLPVIEAEPVAYRGDAVKVVAKTYSEPLDHLCRLPHIQRVSVYFLPEETVSPFFQAQAEMISVTELYYDKQTETISARQEISVQFRPEKTGTIYASSFSNPFGLKKNYKRLVLR